MKLEYLLIICLVVGLIVGYFVAQMSPTHDRTKGKASVFVLSCIDPRYTNDLAWFLTHNQELHADYDLVCLAGASLGVLQHSYPGWEAMFFDHVQLALDLHGIEEIWCFDHLDCGMYKATLKLEKDDDKKIHIQKMEELRKVVRSKFPKLKFRKFIIEINGTIIPV